MNPIRTVNEWDDEYAKLARIAASQFRTTSSGYNTTNNKQQQSQGDIVQLFQQQLYRLDNALSSSTVVPTQITSTLSSTEIQRRKRLLQHLQQTSLPSGTRNAAGPIDLLGGDTTQQQQSNHNQQQQQQSKISMAMRQQDDMIDQLAVGVNRLKQQTTIIGEEANMHLHLMNDIDTNLDSTYNTIHQQTQRAATLREDQSIWRLQLIVVVLVILLIFEILAGISP